MNLRYEILRAVSKNPGAPAAEICDVIDYDRQKTTWSVRDCAKAGLLAMRRDDVTGQPGYALTEAGKERLADGPTKQGGNAKHSQPAVEQNTGSSASDTCTSPAEGAAVQAHPAPDHAADVSAAAPVAADVKPQTAEIPPQTTPQIPPPQYDPRSVAFAASTDAEHDQQRAHLHLIGVLADIRAAVGDPEGRLMQDELVERVRAVAKAGAVANADLVKIRDTLQPMVYTGDPAHAPGPVTCAEHAAQWLKSLGETNSEQLAGIVAASERLAPFAPGAIDTSDMDLHEIAEAVAGQIADLAAQLVQQADELRNLKALNEKLEHLLQSARNEAEHLRKHAPAPDTTTMDSVPLDALLDAVRAFVPSSALLTVSGHPGTVSIAAFGHKFHVQAKDALDVLDHIRALDNYLDIPF